jgi:hypothetical protein
MSNQIKSCQDCKHFNRLGYCEHPFTLDSSKEFICSSSEFQHFEPKKIEITMENSLLIAKINGMIESERELKCKDETEKLIVLSKTIAYTDVIKMIQEDSLKQSFSPGFDFDEPVKKPW